MRHSVVAARNSASDAVRAQGFVAARVPHFCGDRHIFVAGQRRGAAHRRELRRRCTFAGAARSPAHVTAANTELMMEEQRKEVEQDLEQAILKGRRFGISDEDIKTLFELILEG